MLQEHKDILLSRIKQEFGHDGPKVLCCHGDMYPFVSNIFTIMTFMFLLDVCFNWRTDNWWNSVSHGVFHTCVQSPESDRKGKACLNYLHSWVMEKRMCSKVRTKCSSLHDIQIKVFDQLHGRDSVSVPQWTEEHMLKLFNWRYLHFVNPWGMKILPKFGYQNPGLEMGNMFWCGCGWWSEHMMTEDTCQKTHLCVLFWWTPLLDERRNFFPSEHVQ